MGGGADGLPRDPRAATATATSMQAELLPGLTGATPCPVSERWLRPEPFPATAKPSELKDRAVNGPGTGAAEGVHTPAPDSYYLQRRANCAGFWTLPESTSPRNLKPRSWAERPASYSSATPLLTGADVSASVRTCGCI